MSIPEQWSGRWSDRVESSATMGEASGSKEPIKAPESLLPAGSPLAAERAARRVARRRLATLSSDLSDREQAVLQSLAAYRYLSTGQLQRLHFADHATDGAASRICRRVLRRLGELRIIEHLERRIGGIRAGSASFVWRVGPVGDRLLRQAAGDGTRARRKEPSLRYLDHCLAVADCYVHLVEATRCGRLELLSHQAEPSCWRPYLGSHGGTEILKPDLYAVTASGEFEDSWFIEVDRSTESLPTLLRKCAQYQRYWRSGREQHERGVFPAVLWVVPDEPRAQALVQGIRRAYGPDQELFRVTTSSAFSNVIVGGA